MIEHGKDVQLYISYWCVSVLGLFHLFGPRMTEHFLYFSFVREWHESSSHIPPFLVLYSTLQQQALLRSILPFSYIIYKISSTNYLCIIQILFITINSLVLYSTLPQPTPLYIDPHRSALACFASGVSEGRFSKWWVDVDIAQHIHFIIRLENERTLDLYNYSFILLPNINCFVMLNIHTISSMTVESGGYIIRLYITGISKKDEWDN